MMLTQQAVSTIQYCSEKTTQKPRIVWHYHPATLTELHEMVAELRKEYSGFAPGIDLEMAAALTDRGFQVNLQTGCFHRATRKEFYACQSK